MVSPLYSADSKAIVPLSSIQKKTIDVLLRKISDGDYKTEENVCLCGNIDYLNDIVVSEKDRYGLPIKTLLCNKCGLLRSSPVFDNKSNLEFYKNEYRSLYMGEPTPPEYFFRDQVKRGELLFALFNEVVKEKIKSVFEIGCGSGGIMYPFYEAGYDCSGCDYDKGYVKYGVDKGLKLEIGDYNCFLDSGSVDLIILSHVMEHFLDPISEMKKIITKLAPGGYLLIEVPGIFNFKKTCYSPLQYFQNSHAYHYYADYLNVFFDKLGLTVISGDERCVFVVKKPLDWDDAEVSQVFDARLCPFPPLVMTYLLEARREYLFPQFRLWLTSMIRKMLHCFRP